MQKLSRRSLYGASTALVLTLATFTAQADVLPVQNLDFNLLGSPFTQQKDFFSTVKPTDWSTGTAGAGGALTYVGQQGSEGFAGSPGNIYPVYTNPGFSVTVPTGTNFFQADGNPKYEDTIFQTVTGLTAGTMYTLQFQQAAGQQTGFSGATTELWKVFLGNGGIGVDCSSNPCTVTGTAGDQEKDSPLMSNASKTNTDWQSVNLTFTATASSEVLTFLAWGDGGMTNNLPPTVFLEGVNTPPIPTPEPATLTILGVGLVGLGAIKRLRRARPDASV